MKYVQSTSLPSLFIHLRFLHPVLYTGNTLFIHNNPTVTHCIAALPQQSNVYIYNKAFVEIHPVGFIKAFSRHTITAQPHYSLN